MININKYKKVIDKLIELTSTNKIIWQPTYIATYDRADDVVSMDNVYTIKIKHLDFRIFKYTYNIRRRSFFSLRKCHKEGYKLEILFSKEVIHTFPPIDTIKDLYEIIKAKMFNINNILDKIINDDIVQIRKIFTRGK